MWPQSSPGIDFVALKPSVQFLLNVKIFVIDFARNFSLKVGMYEIMLRICLPCNLHAARPRSKFNLEPIIIDVSNLQYYENRQPCVECLRQKLVVMVKNCVN